MTPMKTEKTIAKWREVAYALCTATDEDRIRWSCLDDGVAYATEVAGVGVEFRRNVRANGSDSYSFSVARSGQQFDVFGSDDLGTDDYYDYRDYLRDLFVSILRKDKGNDQALDDLMEGLAAAEAPAEPEPEPEPEPVAEEPVYAQTDFVQNDYVQPDNGNWNG